MFFALAIPALLEAALTVATGTIAARVASDLYDKATAADEDEDEDE